MGLGLKVRRPRRISKSGKVAGFQGGIGLVDDLQFLFCRFVPAVGVGVVALDEFLVARLERRQCQRKLEPEHRERLFLRRARPRPLARTLGRLLGIEETVVFPAQPISPADAAAKRPSRPLPDRVGADLRLDLGLAHARVVIPGGVIGPHVVEAEPIEGVQLRLRARRPEISVARAARMVARPQRRNRWPYCALQQYEEGAEARQAGQYRPAFPAFYEGGSLTGRGLRPSLALD